jgi:glutamyl-tRNA(Gln) amidotransferase subunit E
VASEGIREKIGESMKHKDKNEKNYLATKRTIGYKSLREMTDESYRQIGFKCGLEIHQQLTTEKKLFCRCPTGMYQEEDDFDAEVVRHMRPTLSELGEYDGTALMEFKTKKNIIYRVKHHNACTYEIDDTPPFLLDQEALDIALEIALLLKLNIVGELHITRKQYLDGSIPTGFQRTGIIGIEGEIPLSTKRKVRIIQMSLEEDSCREVSDIGHDRIFRTDRLGMPLIETVTYPDFKTPKEVAEGAQYLRFLTRSTGKVNTGIGAARQDVNVSVTGGKRVEIKGVAHIKWIPKLTHNEAFRQLALLEIRERLRKVCPNPKKWQISSQKISSGKDGIKTEILKDVEKLGYKIYCVNLPYFKNILSFFQSPGRIFADELADRLKVIACIEKPNLIHSEMFEPVLIHDQWNLIKKRLESSDKDAQIILWGPEADIPTALETVEERCRLAFEGVLNETRKAFQNGNTCFERVLPGPDRMYPDTDSVPIPIREDDITEAGKNLPREIFTWQEQLKKWKVPSDALTYILKNNLCPIIEQIVREFSLSPIFVSTLFAHRLKYLEGQYPPSKRFPYSLIYDLFQFVLQLGLKPEILKAMLPFVYQNPNMDFNQVLKQVGYKRTTLDGIKKRIIELRKSYQDLRVSNNKGAEVRWLMGQIRPLALGNIHLKEIQSIIEGNTDER